MPQTAFEAGAPGAPVAWAAGADGGWASVTARVDHSDVKPARSTSAYEARGTAELGQHKPESTPPRHAIQAVGGSLIFVRRDAVRGLTAAAAVWLTAGIGMACGVLRAIEDHPSARSVNVIARRKSAASLPPRWAC